MRHPQSNKITKGELVNKQTPSIIKQKLKEKKPESTWRELRWRRLKLQRVCKSSGMLISLFFSFLILLFLIFYYQSLLIVFASLFASLCMLPLLCYWWWSLAQAWLELQCESLTAIEGSFYVKVLGAQILLQNVKMVFCCSWIFNLAYIVVN